MSELIMDAVLAAIGGAGGGDLVSKTVTENKTYRASDDGHDGYSQVIVQVPLGSDTFTANGDYWYDPSKAMTKGGWWHITVSVPSVGYYIPDNTPLPPMPMDIVENLTDTDMNITVKKKIYYNDPDYGGRSGCEFYYNITTAGVTTKVRLDGVNISNPSTVSKIYDAYFTMTDPSTGAWEASVVVVWSNGMSPTTYHFSGTNRGLINFGDPTHTRTITNDEEEQT
jgi:hypothetical protein